MKHTRSALSLVEIIIALVILSLAMVPTIGMLTGGRERAHMSESQIYAELVAARITEDLSTRHYGYAYRSPAQDAGWFTRLHNIDKGEDWYNDLKEYEHNAFKGPRPLDGTVWVTKVGTPAGAGLMSFEVTATWGNLHGATHIKGNSLSLVRLRAKRDYVMRSVEGVDL